MVILETGFALVLVGYLLFLGPLILKVWEAYCGWLFKDKD